MLFILKISATFLITENQILFNIKEENNAFKLSDTYSSLKCPTVILIQMDCIKR